MTPARAPVGMLCRCNHSLYAHRHLDIGDYYTIEHPGPITRSRDANQVAAWRALAHEDYEVAKAQLLKEIFG